jgi:hypothetical protein
MPDPRPGGVGAVSGHRAITVGPILSDRGVLAVNRGPIPRGKRSPHEATDTTTLPEIRRSLCNTHFTLSSRFAGRFRCVELAVPRDLGGGRVSLHRPGPNGYPLMAVVARPQSAEIRAFLILPGTTLRCRAGSSSLATPLAPRTSSKLQRSKGTHPEPAPVSRPRALRPPNPASARTGSRARGRRSRMRVRSRANLSPLPNAGANLKPSYLLNIQSTVVFLFVPAGYGTGPDAVAECGPDGRPPALPGGSRSIPGRLIG